MIRVEVRYFDNGQWLPLPDAEVTVIHTTTTVQNPKPKMTDINGIAEFPPMPIGLINFEVFKDLYGPAPAVGQPPKVARWTEMVNCSSVVARLKTHPDLQHPGNALPIRVNVEMATTMSTFNKFMKFDEVRDGVTYKRLHYDFGELLKDLGAFPPGTHARHLTEFVYQELDNKNLVAAIPANLATTTLLKYLTPDTYDYLLKDLLNFGKDLVNALAVAVSYPDGNWIRGFVLISNAQSQVARTWGWSRDRRYLAGIVAHEINHFRNRVLIGNIGNGYDADYVDPNRARATIANARTTEHVRRSFILEIAARLEAWYVWSDIDGVPNPRVPGPPGVFWNQIAQFSDWYNAWTDNGYMASLPPLQRREQAYRWLLTCANHLIYVDDATENAAIAQMMRSEAALGRQNGYQVIPTVPAALPAGF